ncbi:MAG TPA: N,N-dimethylformamidase beta subunit family domain-containing protein, partial [Solirubrobacteraceae bacterium]|nr:N,N-dimethylformamidase beta subunit family domain-containing protein [Solirubrobacteraceae bacterium]
ATDVDLHADPHLLDGAHAMVTLGHDEYWSTAMRAHATAARDRGVNLAFLSSDTLAWRVRFGPAGAGSSEAGAPAHRITSYKEHVARDPVRSSPSGAFTGNGASLTGSAYVGCITPRVPTPGRAVYRYYDWTPDPARGPAWLFAGTGLSAGRAVHAILGYELDQRTAASPPGVAVLGGGRAPCQPGTAGPSARGDTTLYRARSGALVFGSGTLGWELGLSPVLAASPEAPSSPDAGLVALTRNLLDRMLGSWAPSR